MARTKGAKGKKTLAKEMGMTLEEYQNYLAEQNKGDKIENNPSIDSKPLSGQITLKDIEVQSEQENKDESLSKIDKPEEPKKLITPAIPDFTPDTMLVSPEYLNNLTKKNESKSKQSKQYPQCDRCHCDITTVSPSKINLTYLTTMPEYHRKTESDHGRVLLCDDCKKDLNKLIDWFLFDEGKGIPLKFGLADIKSFKTIEAMEGT